LFTCFTEGADERFILNQKLNVNVRLNRCKSTKYHRLGPVVCHKLKKKHIRMLLTLVSFEPELGFNAVGGSTMSDWGDAATSARRALQISTSDALCSTFSNSRSINRGSNCTPESI